MIKLTRMNSDSPNIQNYDDARMFRYANGGFSAITKDYGEELAGSDAGSHIFHIGTGEVTHQGWQVEINGAGLDIELDNISTLEYYTIYLEINLLVASLQTATIKSLKGTSSYPTVTPGDDLTTVNTGTSRLVLFKVKLDNGVMSIARQIDVLPYMKDNLIIENGKLITKDSMYARYTDENHTNKTIEQRLTELGFKTGAATTSGIIVNQYTYRSNSVRKIGKYVLFTFVIGTDQYPAWTQAMASQAHTITVPEWARPKSTNALTYQIREHIRASFDNGEVSESTMGTAYVSYTTTINTSGVISITCGGDRVSAWGSDIRVTSQYQYPAGGIVIYCGWEIN